MGFSAGREVKIRSNEKIQYLFDFLAPNQPSPMTDPYSIGPKQKNPGKGSLAKVLPKSISGL